MVKKTVGKIEKNSMSAKMHQYEMVGRAAPTEKIPVPKIFKMKIFAKNVVIARSKFWYFMKRINCAKRTGGQMLRETEIFDKSPTRVTNYGINLRYESRTDTHNMYKEYRDTTITGAMSQVLSEMSGRHRAQAASIQIKKTCEVANSNLRRDHAKQMIGKKLRFPVVRKMPMQPKTEKKLLRTKRYTTYAQ